MMKSGFIGIIGRPNVGKSTLLNSILGEKVAITTDKPQTTRNSIRGIYTRFDDETATGNDGVQMVFIDTPGIHKARNKLGEAMTEMAVNTYKEVDVVLFLVDGSMKKGPGDKYILEMIRSLDTPKILVINKIDKMGPEEYKEIFEEYEETGVFDAIYGTSALEGKNVPQLLAKIETYLEEGPMFFPEDMVTDHPERFIVSEIIREKVLNYLEEEVPHGVAIEIESYKEEPNITRIGAVIYCERKSHKGIIIGKQGKKLKGIGKSARLEIEALLGTKVFLQLWVKVKENWRDSDFALSNFGYKE
ncbi:MAG: GTPase Era [Emergencia sp.]|nr:GTPase Era [Emergencia sp.]